MAALDEILRALRETGVGVGEAALSLGSGMAAAPVAGFAGIGQLLQGKGLGAARDKIEGVQDAMTYAPRTDVGQRGMANIGGAIEPITTKLRENIADPVGERSPLLGAALIAGGEMLGPKGAKVPKPKGFDAPPSVMAEILREQQAPAVAPSSTAAPILPRGESIYTPGVEQTDLPRLTPMGKVPKTNERTQALIESATARKRVDEMIGKGRELGVQEWYGTEPLRQFALNEGLSPEEFDRMLGHLASASQRNPVAAQNRMGSVLWGMDKRGEFTPESRLLTNKLRKQGAVEGEGGYVALPEGYGSLAQSDIFNRSRDIALGKIDEALPPDAKLGTFYRNLQGNLRPVTIDVNALRGPVMASKRPDWLATKLVQKDDLGNITGTYTPRADFESGKLTMAQAMERPTFWEAAPKGPSEYAGLERLWQNAAKRHSIQPAEAQALGWYGSGDITALKSAPELYIANLERLARIAADRQGITPVEAMRRFVKGAKGGQLGNIKPEVAAALAGGSGVAALVTQRLRKDEEEQPKKENDDGNP